MNDYRKLTKEDIEDTIKIFRDAMFFFAIVAYFTGWVYLNEYLGSFGIYLSNMELPFYYYLIYCYPPFIAIITEPSLSDFIGIVLIIIFSGFCFYSYRVKDLYGYVAAFFLFLCIIGVSFNLAVTKSSKHSLYVKSGGGKKINFHFKKEIGQKLDNELGRTLLNDNLNGSLRLIWRTKTDVYVVRSSKSNEEKLKSIHPTYRIPIKNFHYSQTIGNSSL